MLFHIKPNKKASFVMCLLMLFAMIVPVYPETVHAAAQSAFYVAPNGSDSNPGTQEQPFATLAKARDAVRAINSNMTGDIYVYIASGNYYVNSPISFDERDSGTNGFQVIYTNLDGLGTAKFIGGNKVTSAWNLVTRTGADADLPASAAGNVYKTYVGTGIQFNTLYVNDSRAVMARTKNLNVDPRFPASQTDYMRSAGGGISTLIYNSSDIDATSLAGLVNAQARGELDAQVYMWDGGYWDWMTDTIPLSGINTSTRTLTFKTDPKNAAAYRPKYATGTNARYFLQGNLGFLDQPGEYYFNKTTGYLYYYPLAGSGSIENQDIVIPAVKKIIDIKGASRTSMVSHITFNGLEFKDTDFSDYYSYGWNWGDGGVGVGFYPPSAAGSTQPSYCEQTERVEFQVGVITLTNTSNITISNSHIKNAGMFGIELYLANQYTNINNSLIEYTGHGGVNIEGGYPGVGGDANGDGYSHHNTVTNTMIHDAGQLVGQSAGITVNNSGYNTFSHLEIYNSPRRGIFVTAGWSRNPNVAFPNGDKNYNPMTDLYTHHNTFEYIYLHDMQQDGGDDGAFFACYLFKGSTNYKPNYINQMVIDSVGANPSMTDIAPNGMNLDMGASGFQVSNLKIVNPQHFNAEVNTTTQYGDKITFTNTNIDFGKHTNQLATFNDSLMDYANIGIGADFPSVYLPARDSFQEPDNIYIKDDFESGMDWTKWTYQGVKPVVTTEWMSEGGLHGKKALKIDSDAAPSGSKPVLYRDFGGSLNKIVTVKMFDRQSSNLVPYDSGTTISSTVKSLARVDNGVQAVGMGLDTTVNNKYYVVMNGSTETATSIPRTYGWHELKWDYTSGNDVKLYIDGVLVQTLTTITNFSRVELGSDSGKGVSFYDQFYIYGGTVTPPPNPLPMPPESIPGKIEAEDFIDMSGIQKVTASEGTLAVGDFDAGDWIDYKVNVAAAGAYKVNYRVAVNSGSTGEVELQLNGVKLKTTSLPSTGGMQNWVTVSDTVTLSAGLQTIRLYITKDGWNLNWFQFEKYVPVPGKIEAEDYNAMYGIQTEPASEGTLLAGYLDVGDWMDYNVNVASAGTYTVNYRVAVNTGYSGEVQLQVNGVNLKTTSFPSTGGWQNWVTVSDKVTLQSGPQTMRLYVSKNGWNINWFELQSVASTPSTNTIQAENYSSQKGTATHSAGTGTVVGNIDPGDWMAYNNIDFGTGISQFVASVAVDSGYAGKQLQLRLDSTTGPLIGTLTIKSTGGWDTYATQTCAVSGVSGVHNLYIVGAGSGEGVGNIDWFKFMTDKILPADATFTADETGPTNTDVNVTIHYPDNVSKKEYKTGTDGTWTMYTDPIVMTANGTVYARSTDDAGSTSNVTSYEVSNIDKVAPESSVAVTPAEPDGQNGWYTHPLTLELASSDKESGVAKLEYSLDGGSTWIPYDGPVVLDQDGKAAVSYRSTDKAGNVEDVKIVSFNLDTTAPVIEVTVPEDGSTYEDSGDFTPQIALTDNMSGIDNSKTTVTLDTNAYQIGTTVPLYKLPLGLHTLVVTSSDMAGNQGSKTVQFQTVASVASLQALVNYFVSNNEIDNAGIANSLQAKLKNNNLNSFVNEVQAQSGKHISSEAAEYLLRDAQYVLAQK
ncbi:carbohydrate-binding protein [Paenibacillus sp. KQZ6P-2]|uniref:Carbohydrate-binding protein n=1 Tax=Paenibacillus mangrovi TaxID=2931978 RepID=A0A9X1WS08_9BACL|nr:carbohydrate-binding protein [Paenibacillus mangrovi]MCJ8014217.1 carbohydrate-binding protein [Paenibacillus mangrovi]